MTKLQLENRLGGGVQMKIPDSFQGRIQVHHAEDFCMEFENPWFVA